MFKLSEEEKAKISNYSYEQTNHALLEIEGNIIDYKIAINNKVSFLKNLKQHKELELISKIAGLKMQREKYKTTYVALATNEELSYFERVTRRNNVKQEIKKNKVLSKAAKKLSTLSDYNDYYEVFSNNDISLEDKKKRCQEILASAKKVDKSKEIATAENELENLKLELKKYKQTNKEKRRILYWQKVKTAKYGRLADEKKAILKLDKNKDSDSVKELNNQYRTKLGKVLKYQSNILSYYTMLLAVLFEIIYIIIFLNKMYVSYMEFPTLIINLIFTLVLFLSAMKVKVYSKTWTTINFVYSAYLLVRIFFVIPFVAKDHDAVLSESGEVVQTAIDYSNLRETLYIISAIMLVLILFANIRSAYKIKQRQLYLD